MKHDMQLHPGSSIRICTICGAGELLATKKPCVRRSQREELELLANEIHAVWVCEKQGDGEFAPDWIDSIHTRLRTLLAASDDGDNEGEKACV